MERRFVPVEMSSAPFAAPWEVYTYIYTYILTYTFLCTIITLSNMYIYIYTYVQGIGAIRCVSTENSFS